MGLAQGLLESWITLASCISCRLRAISSLTAKGTWRTGYFRGMASPVSMCSSIRSVSPRSSLLKLKTSWYSSNKVSSCSSPEVPSSSGFNSSHSFPLLCFTSSSATLGVFYSSVTTHDTTPWLISSDSTGSTGRTLPISVSLSKF